ncbi:hypothetical protein GUITHDRAFT_152307 [Guillardia theta CCMP2712]|uniref:Major facilitator superfamily (MFS) profile domain-containing protein n=1 Tax=Guillardia theta (strain CCMP2712) TaxID=905079 RepID=L1JF11_GUITC|nr:hypothetical protein GUITHDRAFT_152307 [Guillardia theta CCMP2712]EKX46719.1 hypothetical protein GUITHDRAFT_152307 [Guillardia theta CCMP2712]|eukprot:XP_005833699.1 hypothetical protein GUITHDRAFT_152307 [Guillardia theta CCMP2712]
MGISGMLLVGSYAVRVFVHKRMDPKVSKESSISDAPYVDVDSLDYGFSTGSRAVKPLAGPKLYPERWLMLFVYSLNMCTLSVLASALPSSQLPAQQLYGVDAYPIVTLMSVLVFLTLPGTAMSSLLFPRYGIKGTCCIGLFLGALGAWMMVVAAYKRSWNLQIAATVMSGLGGPMLANACTGFVC